MTRHIKPTEVRACFVHEDNLDTIAEVNGGLKPEVETPNAIYVDYQDPETPNDIMSQEEFFANYILKPFSGVTVWVAATKY